MEWIHGGGHTGWRKSSQRGRGTSPKLGMLSNSLWNMKYILAGGKILDILKKRIVCKKDEETSDLECLGKAL